MLQKKIKKVPSHQFILKHIPKVPFIFVIITSRFISNFTNYLGLICKVVLWCLRYSLHCMFLINLNCHLSILHLIHISMLYNLMLIFLIHLFQLIVPIFISTGSKCLVYLHYVCMWLSFVSLVVGKWMKI